MESYAFPVLFVLIGVMFGYLASSQHNIESAIKKQNELLRKILEKMEKK